jgi:arsenate reductase
MRKHLLAVIAMLGLLGATAAAQGTSAQTVAPGATVLFVCEHGAAKSVIAAAHFNQIAKQRGLPYRAVARGTAPDPAIPGGVRQGLAQAGLELSVEKPLMVGQADVDGATRIVTFEIALPPAVASSSKPPTDWKAVPAVSADFGVASAEIRRRVEALIDELAAKK